MASKKGDIRDLWHRRLGHLHMAGVKALINGENVIGVMEHISESSSFCDPCVLAKSTRLPFTDSRPPTTCPLQRIHTDVAGPMEYVSLEGNRYYVTFVDGYTHLTVTYPIKRKCDVFQRFKDYHQMSTAHFNTKIECPRSDSGGEYRSKEFQTYLRENGIRAKVTSLTTQSSMVWRNV